MPAPARRKIERIQVRVNSETKALIERAAAVSDADLTSFVVAAARDRAEMILGSHESIQITAANRERFYQLLTNPPAPSASLRSLFKASRAKPVA